MKRAKTDKPDVRHALSYWKAMLSFIAKRQRRTFFNRDASLEIDRLTVEVEELKERLAKHEPVSG